MRGPFWTPITPLTGSFLHADPHNIEPKKAGYPGLQFADLIARPAFAHCRAVYVKDTSDLTAFARQIAPILEDYKFYRDENGNPDRYGRVWRPALKKLNGP